MGTQHQSLISPSPIGINKLSIHGRHHSIGTNPSIHRVTRRKSVSSSATNLAAVAQAVKEGGDTQLALPPPSTSILSRSVGRSVGIGLNTGFQSPNLTTMHGYPSPPSSLPNNEGICPLLSACSVPGNGFTFPRKVPVPTTTISPSGGITNAATSPGSTNRRARRASEGAHTLSESSGETVRSKSGVELKCDKCGKGYKHSSCLTKHLFVSPPPGIMEALNPSLTFSLVTIILIRFPEIVRFLYDIPSMQHIPSIHSYSPTVHPPSFLLTTCDTIPT